MANLSDDADENTLQRLFDGLGRIYSLEVVPSKPRFRIVKIIGAGAGIKALKMNGHIHRTQRLAISLAQFSEVYSSLSPPFCANCINCANPSFYIARGVPIAFAKVQREAIRRNIKKWLSKSFWTCQLPLLLPFANTLTLGILSTLHIVYGLCSLCGVLCSSLCLNTPPQMLSICTFLQQK